MKKQLKTGVGLLIAVTILLGLMPTALGLRESETTPIAIPLDLNDPFAQMYDSDTVFAERAVPILERAELESAMLLEASLASEPSDAFPADKSYSNSGKALRADIVDSLERIGETTVDTELLSEMTVRELEHLYESSRVDRFIIKYKNSASVRTADSVGAESSTAVAGALRGIHVITLIEKVNPAEFASALRRSGIASEIEYIQPDFELGYASLTLDLIDTEDALNETPEDSNDAESEEPGELLQEEIEDTNEELLEAPSSEELEVISMVNSAIIAIIDTGVDYTHPMLSEYMLDGYDFVSGTTSIYDPDKPYAYSHGTHIAGIIAQQAHTFGADVQILPLSVFEDGIAYTSTIIESIAYADDAGARIVNMSFGSTQYNLALYEAIEASTAFFVCAAGNSRSDNVVTPVYPASYVLPNIISVGSVNADDGYSYFSNYNGIDIAARGRDVVSAKPGGGTASMTGTSMAAAEVSGTSAVVMSAQDLSAEELKDRIIRCSDMLSNLQNKVVDGRRVNLRNAMSNTNGAFLMINPADDFDVHGYSPSESELYELYAASGSPVQIVAGSYHNLLLMENGSVWAWGGNGVGQCGNGETGYSETLTQVVGLTNVLFIAAAYDRSLAVKSDGTVWAWGDNSYGQLGDGSTITRTTPVQVIGLTNVLSVAAGEFHSLAMKTDETVWAWGYNFYGQLGDGSTTDRGSPVQVSGLTDVFSVAAGGYHSLAIKTDGTVWAWGDNTYYQLGDGSTTGKIVPSQINGLSDVESIVADNNRGIAVMSNGTALEWGSYYFYSQLFGGFFSAIPTPNPILGDAVSVAAGNNHSLAIMSDGTMWAWGDNLAGQLGDGNATTNGFDQVYDLTGIILAAAGNSHSVAIKSDGTIWAWGYNGSDQLGTGGTVMKTTPMRVHNLIDTISVAAGNSHSLAVKTDGTVWAWGDNTYGQLGDGSTIARSTPMQINGLVNVVSVSAGSNHSLAVKTDGTVWAWGYNGNGQVGDGSTITRSTPVQINGLVNVVSISAGSNHNLAVKTDGTVWAWGDNSSGQLGDNSTTMRKSPVRANGLAGALSVAAGYNHSLAVKTDGTVWAWGNNSSGQLGDNSTTTRKTPVQVYGLSGTLSVTAGYLYSLAAKNDGTAWAWGYNNYGQLGDGSIITKKTPVQVSGLTSVSTIATGYNHNLAVKADGTVWAWGYNTSSQLGDGGTTTKSTPVQINGLVNVMYVTAGNRHSLAVKADGTAWAWGYNASGQLGDGRISQALTPVQASTPPGVPELLFDDDTYEIGIPNAGTATITVSAIMYDASGQVIPDVNITYGFASPYSGVSINSSTGVITITASVLPGTAVIQAEYEGLMATTTLTLNAGNSISGGCALIIPAINGSFYDIPIIVSNMPITTTPRRFEIHYDQLKLEVETLPFGNQIELLSNDPNLGVIVAEYSGNAPSTFTGILCSVRFKAVEEGSAVIHIEIF